MVEVPLHFFWLVLAMAALGVGIAGAIRRKAQQRKAGADSQGLEDIKDKLDELSSLARRAAHPRQILDSAAFQECLRRWAKRTHSEELLLVQARSGNTFGALVALEVLRLRRIGEGAAFQIIAELGKMDKWPLFFALRALSASTAKPLIGAVLVQAQEIWITDKQGADFLQDFLARRMEGGETPAFGALLGDLPGSRLALIRRLLGRLEPSRVEGLLQELDEVLKSRLDLEFLNGIGRVWGDKELRDRPFPHEALEATVGKLRELLLREPRRSVLLVGEAGTGKTAVVRALAVLLREDGWSIFECRAGDIIAGQIWMGQPEQRARDLLNHLAVERQVIWFIPRFQEMQYVGRHYWNPTSVLDMILPFIEEGKVLVVGELGPGAYGQLLKAQPRVKAAFTAVRLHPLNDRDTLALARSRLPSLAGAEERMLREALNLARQYLTGRETPGSALDLLSAACRKAEGCPGVGLDHVLAALSDSTGLPRAIMDEQAALSVEELRTYFRRRVLGQAEAVDCLVERVAMIKAGLCDPARPSGVFLFVGPTGTGKTEVAKALATFLFGSADRLIRQDMSEFQTSESVSKILGERDGSHDEGSLVGKIRQQPFSVVLLDEFEKANPRIWDLFLQVFDEGRLSDAQGNVADFRHCIFILTSNLGTTLSTGLGIGFTPASAAFSPLTVQKAVAGALRPELLNRIDRVVIFRPLDRKVMREILQNELERVLQRRGLRTRQWAVEWEDSALEFLLTQGFSPELGARPLKRAIDRYLLSPLAITLVSHQVPQGDQFLFVRSDGNRILVEFVDPDAPESSASAVTEEAGAEEAAGPLEPADLRRLILRPAGNEQETRALGQVCEELSTRLQDEKWRSRKADALQQMEDPDFWSSAARFKVLGDLEYMERIKVGLETARSLLQRLGGSGAGSARSPHLVSRLSLQLYLLSEACASLERSQPKDAFLRLEAVPRSGDESGALLDFAERLCRMYLAWAGKRHMRYKVLQDERQGGARRFLLAVSGFGAYSILAAENGLHVFELPEREKAFKRLSVPVRVIAQPDTPPQGEEGLREQARQAFLREAEPERGIVRYYREQPSALVRDAASRWRSGRLDLVLDGNFDLFSRTLRS